MKGYSSLTSHPCWRSIPAEFKLDTGNHALPVDYGDVCINYDKAYFAQHALAVPQSLQDITAPRIWKATGWERATGG